MSKTDERLVLWRKAAEAFVHEHAARVGGPIPGETITICVADDRLPPVTFTYNGETFEGGPPMWGNSGVHMWEGENSPMWGDDGGRVWKIGEVADGAAEPLKINVNDSVKVESAAGTARIAGKTTITLAGAAVVSTPAPKPIAMPPGRGMTRIIDVLFFFSRKKPRVLEETIGDYQREVIDAEYNGKPTRLLHFKYRGIFVWLLIGQIAEGLIVKIVGAIVKAFKSS